MVYLERGEHWARRQKPYIVITIRKGWYMNRNKNKGFSLVELIIVIAIMALLVGALVPQYLGYLARGKRSVDLQNAEAYGQAIYALHMEYETKEKEQPTNGSKLYERLGQNNRHYFFPMSELQDELGSDLMVVKPKFIDNGEFYYNFSGRASAKPVRIAINTAGTGNTDMNNLEIWPIINENSQYAVSKMP